MIFVPWLAAQLGDRAHEPLLHRVLVDVAHERHVELDEVAVERRERAHARVAAAEVVDRDAEAELAQLGDAVADVGLAFERRALGDLEDARGSRRFDSGENGDVSCLSNRSSRWRLTNTTPRSGGASAITFAVCARTARPSAGIRSSRSAASRIAPGCGSDLSRRAQQRLVAEARARRSRARSAGSASRAPRGSARALPRDRASVRVIVEPRRGSVRARDACGEAARTDTRRLLRRTGGGIVADVGDLSPATAIVASYDAPSVSYAAATSM